MMDLVEIRKKAKSRKKKVDTPAAGKEGKEAAANTPGELEQSESNQGPVDPGKGSDDLSGTAKRDEKPPFVDEQPGAGDRSVDEVEVSDSLSGLQSVLMSQHEDKEEEEEEQLQLLTFMLGQEEYGLNIMDIKEIIRTRDVTEVPKTPKYIQGILSLRGTIIPVFDVDKRLGLSTGERGSENRIVVVKWQEHLFGFLVDRVVQVLNIPIDRIDPPPEIFGVEGEFLRGVGKLDDRLIILLNLGRILSLEEVDPTVEPELLPGSDS